MINSRPFQRVKCNRESATLPTKIQYLWLRCNLLVWLKHPNNQQMENRQLSCTGFKFVFSRQFVKIFLKFYSFFKFQNFCTLAPVKEETIVQLILINLIIRITYASVVANFCFFSKESENFFFLVENVRYAVIYVFKHVHSQKNALISFIK